LNRKERKGIKENDKKNPFISLLCALRAFAVKLFRQPLVSIFLQKLLRSHMNCEIHFICYIVAIMLKSFG